MIVEPLSAMPARRSSRLVLAGGVLATVVLVSCSGTAGGDGASDARPAVEPVDIVPGPAETVLLPGALPDGFTVSRVDPGDAEPYGRALVVGPADGVASDPFDDAPLVLIGTSSGSASIAGPAPADGEPIDGLPGFPASPAALVEDGRWTWVLFSGETGCFDDCVHFVVGRGVDGDDLVELARATGWDDTDEEVRPTVDADAVPDGLAVLGTVSPGDGLTGSGATSIDIESPSVPPGGWMTVQSTPADPLLAAAWSFWVDDTGTEVRGHPGRAGPTGATIDRPDVARVWIEDGTLVSVAGWQVDEATVDAVVDGLRPGTADDLAALEGSTANRPITAGDLGALDPAATVLSGPTGVEGWRWGVALSAGGTPLSMTSFEAIVGTAGTSGGGGGHQPLAPVGELTVRRGTVGGIEVDGTFVMGAAPPGTATVELVLLDGTVVPASLADAGPRSEGERWFATFLPGGPPAPVVVARDAAGVELARDDASGG